MVQRTKTSTNRQKRIGIFGDPGTSRCTFVYEGPYGAYRHNYSLGPKRQAGPAAPRDRYNRRRLDS
jgi:hypothetical protein